LAGSQAARADHLPRQQYWSVPNRAHAEMQATTVPCALTSRTLGHFTGLVHPAGTQPFLLILSFVPPDDLVMLMYIGRLDPSTMETS
jgi:hypothetical protein